MSTELCILNPFEESHLVEEIWCDLQSRANSSFFLSWGWIRVWLANLQAGTRLSLLVLRNGEKPDAACFLGRSDGFRHRFFHKRQGFLNITGVPELDSLCLEYNGAVGPGSNRLLTAMLSADALRDLEEFSLPFLNESDYRALKVPDDLSIAELEVSSSHLVNLQELRHSGVNYQQQLGSNRRRQLRQSLRYYGGESGLELAAAQSEVQALSMLESLRALHQKEWQRRGFPGAFASEFFVRFHRQLIRERFDAGEIQLLEIRSQGAAIAYLYNFVFNNRVLFYQSGMNYEANDNKARPGLVAHYLAIQHNLMNGLDEYNFLAGDRRYKQGMATNTDKLYSVRLVRSGLKSNLEAALVRVLRATRGTRKPWK